MTDTHAPKCLHCGQLAVATTGREIYPHREDLHRKMFYICHPCDAYVGTHRRTLKPLGMPANKSTRQARMAVHALFDPFWKWGDSARSTLYARLAKDMGLTSDECHIGRFTIEQCAQAKKAISKWKS